jgi:hypothetical protein
MVNPSDVLAKMIAEAQGKLEERHYAPNPIEQARIDRRAMYQRRMRRKYAAHGVAEFLQRIA